MTTESSKKVGIGIIGCGAISQAYFDGAKAFPILHILACADLNEEVAKAKAKENGCDAISIEKLLAHTDIDIVINLTIPAAHASVNMQILNAGKHAYCEKPFAVELADGKEVLEFAEAKGLRVGCAPDTFFGAGIQTGRDVIDSGRIGEIRSGLLHMLSHGPESWHPNPGFYYLKGGGPVFDMAPYYLTAVVNLLGPVKRVSGFTSKSYPERIATSELRMGEILPVEVNTHASSTLEFQSGAIITAIFSFDVYSKEHARINLYGTKGTIHIPDPNLFDGEIEVFDAEKNDWENLERTRLYKENRRGIGVADMAHAIANDRPHRANGGLAYHVLEVIHGFDKSSESGRAVEIESQPDRPAALPSDLAEGVLD